MANYDTDDLFSQYYSLYRAEATIPASTDDEYTIFKRLSKESINRWANYDGMYWKELFTTLQIDGGGSQTIVTNQTDYLVPSNFREAGGYVRVKDSSGNTVQSYAIIEPQQFQFSSPQSTYAYFSKGTNYYVTGTASQSTTTVTGVGTTWTSAMVGMQIVFVTGETATITAFGSTTSLTVDTSQTVASGTYRIVNSNYTLRLNPAPLSNLNGLDIDYVYYKNPTYLSSGGTMTEMANPMFIVHRALANRFRASRNPYYEDALRDAENILTQMKMDNDSGSWANPWTLTDNSGTVWGEDIGTPNIFNN